MYSVAKHILGQRRRRGSLQDIFHQLWRNAASFDSARGSLSGWLLVMARNRSIDRLRRRDPAERRRSCGDLARAGAGHRERRRAK